MSVYVRTVRVVRGIVAVEVEGGIGVGIVIGIGIGTREGGEGVREGKRGELGRVREGYVRCAGGRKEGNGDMGVVEGERKRAVGS